MKKIICLFAVAVLTLLWVPAQADTPSKNYVIGFYNLENLFDTYNDPAKNDEEFLPDGKNRWTDAKYRKKLHNMATVISTMAESNGVFHTILGVSEIENRLVLEDLVSQPEIARANYQIVHYDSPDARGIDVGLLYRPDQFAYLDSESIPFTFDMSIKSSVCRAAVSVIASAVTLDAVSAMLSPDLAACSPRVDKSPICAILSLNRGISAPSACSV